MSVVAQNAELTLEPGSNILIEKMLVAAYTTSGDAARKVISVGDLYSEDEKDLLFEIRLPVVTTPHSEPLPVLQATLRYFSITASRMEEASAVLYVARPLV